MKLRALARISGPMGNRVPGEEFVVDAATGRDLVDRRIAEQADEVPVAAAHPVKAVKAKVFQE